MQRQLLVSGSRHGRVDVPAELDSYLELEGWPSRLITGGARGVDKQAVDWARKRGVPFVEVPVEDDEWDDFGPRAGHYRNGVLADMCNPGDHLVAFPVGRSPGTHGMIRLAKKRALHCYVLDLKRPYVYIPGVGELFL